MTDKPKIIRGAKGSPPPPPQPTRTPDTLHSRQFATFLDLISEGEIEGFASASKEGLTQGTTAYNNAALKDVFLNDTPVLKATATSASPASTDFNFQDVGFNPRFGTSNQTKVEGIESSSSITAVGVTVTASTPVTRQITNSNVDAANITITVPQLQKATDQGDLLGSSISFKISVQYNSGGFTDIITDTITGRTADAYQRDYRINLTGAFPVDIRVSRITADSSDSSLQDAFQWTSFGEIIDDSSTYANSAYASLRLDSMQFQSIPSRKYRIRGIKIRIPGAGANSSGTPSIDSATGRIIYPDGYIFNGVMGAAQWCSCPAMVLLDLLLDTRYGFGNHIAESSLDLFSFVTASKFANTLVSDGLGGQEARFSCNVNIQSSSEAFDLINELVRCNEMYADMVCW
jgi:predicted phage tail protein